MPKMFKFVMCAQLTRDEKRHWCKSSRIIIQQLVSYVLITLSAAASPGQAEFI